MRTLEEGDLHPEQVAHIAHVLGLVPEQGVVSMNRRLAASDTSLSRTSRNQ